MGSGRSSTADPALIYPMEMDPYYLAPLGTDAASFAAFVGLILWFESDVRAAIPGHTYLIVVYSVGILHFWYDSFIWKLRRPAVARDLGIAVAPAT